jgi:hypothetical protein
MKTKREYIEEINLDWLVGFIEGEGCFTCLSKFNNTTFQGKRWYYKKYQPQFLIAQKGRQVLDKIVKFLSKYKVKARVWLKQTGKDNYELRVCGYDNCLKIINLLEGRFQVDYKREQFEKWKLKINENKNKRGKIKKEDLIRKVKAGVPDPTDYE